LPRPRCRRRRRRWRRRTHVGDHDNVVAAPALPRARLVPVAAVARGPAVDSVYSGKPRCTLFGCHPLTPPAHIARGTPCTGRLSAAVASPGSYPPGFPPRRSALRRRGSPSRRQRSAPSLPHWITFPPLLDHDRTAGKDGRAIHERGHVV
jgi:hypothetical protein